MEFKHISIMAEECMKALSPERGGVYVDCTAGGGGHSFEIAKRLPAGSKIISLDRDDDAIAACTARLSDYSDKSIVVKSNFSGIGSALLPYQRKVIFMIRSLLFIFFVFQVRQCSQTGWAATG